MDEQTLAVETVPSTVQTTLEIPKSGTPEYAQWRMTGELPEKEVEPNADSAPADTPKEETSDNDAGPEPAKKAQEQHRRKPDAESRIGQLTAEVRQLKRELEESRRPRETERAESSPAKPAQPQNYQEWRKEFKPTSWTEQYIGQNPNSTWEDAQAALADYMADARDYFRQVESKQKEQKTALDKMVHEARDKYENFDEVRTNFLGKVMGNDGSALIPALVLSVIGDSEHMADLVYTLGSDSAEAQKFVDLAKANPNKAIRYIAKVENLIEAELSQPRNDKGQFSPKEESEPEPAPKAPVKRGPESAPAPPVEIGSRGGANLDDAESAFQAIERGDDKAVRAWLKADNAKDLRRRRGA